ncbi:MAG: hypothetical protein LBB81_03280 [Treponema sp.]|jgi:hypothetical protein|nr:hypothetical protein [Treponema sp.]
MNKQQPSDPGSSPEVLIKEIETRLKTLMEAFAKHQAGAKPHELKYIRSREDMIEKMPFVEKALQLALENQELFPPAFIDKFWESYDNFLNMGALYDSVKGLEKRLLEICPEAAGILNETGTTTTNSGYNFTETEKKDN